MSQLIGQLVVAIPAACQQRQSARNSLDESPAWCAGKRDQQPSPIGC
jgi:hypothetical protein